MANKASNHIKYLIATKVIDFLNDDFKIILMDTGFIFDPDAHALYGDVLADELGAGFGYLQGDKLLTGIAVTEDDANDRCAVTWNAASWLAAAGAIGPTPGAIIYDDTVANDPIVGFIDFGSEFTQVDGGTMTIAAPAVNLN